MPTPLSSNLPWEMANPKWAAALNPLIASPLSSAIILPKVALINGVTTINHGLGRNMQGWFQVDIDGAASVYRSQPFNNQTLTLTSNAAVNIIIGVF